MKKVLTSFLILFCFSCGNKVTDAPDNTDSLLLGLWDSVANTSTVCHERLKLNADNTFWWFDAKVVSSGTYGRDKDQVNFMFTTKAWENIKFSVTDRELYLSRVGISKVYTRVPLSTANISPCPSEGVPPKIFLSN